MADAVCEILLNVVGCKVHIAELRVETALGNTVPLADRGDSLLCILKHVSTRKHFKYPIPSAIPAPILSWQRLPSPPQVLHLDLPPRVVPSKLNVGWLQ